LAQSDDVTGLRVTMPVADLMQVAPGAGGTRPRAACTSTERDEQFRHDMHSVTANDYRTARANDRPTE
jgi:hypothetical protein